MGMAGSLDLDKFQDTACTFTQLITEKLEESGEMAQWVRVLATQAYGLEVEYPGPM